MKKCGNLIAYFEGKIYCEGNPEEAIKDGEHLHFDSIEFEHFECDTTANIISNVDVDKERKCDDFEEEKRLT